MRITNSMISDNALRNITKAANRLAKANEAASSQEKIQLASDDPVVATRAVSYRSYVAQIKQSQDAADAAGNWQKATDDALSQLSDVIASAKELTTKAANDTNSESDLATIADAIETLRDQAVSIMNTSYAGRYIFGGYSTSEEPYKTVSSDIGDTITYKGSYLSLGGVVSADVSDSDLISFYSMNEDEAYESNATINTTAAKAKTAYENITTAITTYGGTTTLSTATASAKAAYEAAATAAAADATNTTLTDAATAAQSIYDTLNTAASTYGGAAMLSSASTAMETVKDVLADCVSDGKGTTALATLATKTKTSAASLTTAITAYGGTTTLTAAAATALADYNTAAAAATADPSSSSLAAAAKAAKSVSDSLADAVTTYGGTTTVADASTAEQTLSDTLSSAVSTYGTAAESINYNIGFSTQVTVNIEGQDAVGEGAENNLFDTFSKLLLALQGDTTYKTASVDSTGTVTVSTQTMSISDLIDEFSADLDRLTFAQSTLGARMDEVDAVSDKLDDAYTAYTGYMTDNEQVDLATAATEVSSAEYCYEASLSVGAKVISKTLIDYIT
ncbi:flagellar hook-associated protein FlgL [Azotosporobacter soli]|uniref:flagellar hook-associated protein FlgL n=1 Tax=Azotosporobacter soli TaxID=3055040 RepID=UPI0031FEF013